MQKNKAMSNSHCLSIKINDGNLSPIQTWNLWQYCRLQALFSPPQVYPHTCTRERAVTIPENREFPTFYGRESDFTKSGIYFFSAIPVSDSPNSLLSVGGFLLRIGEPFDLELIAAPKDTINVI